MTSEIKQRFSNALHLNEQNAHKVSIIFFFKKKILYIFSLIFVDFFFKEAYLEYLSTLSLIASELQNINKNGLGFFFNFNI